MNQNDLFSRQSSQWESFHFPSIYPLLSLLRLWLPALWLVAACGYSATTGYAEYCIVSISGSQLNPDQLVQRFTEAVAFDPTNRHIRALRQALIDALPPHSVVFSRERQ